MLKDISNLGSVLNKPEQQSINGGDPCNWGCRDETSNRCGPCEE